MSVEATLPERLAAVRRDFDAVAALRARQAELGSVPNALEEFDRRLADVDAALAGSAERRARLAAERARLERAEADSPYAPRVPPSTSASPLGRVRRQPAQAAAAEPRAGPARTEVRDQRRRLKRIVNRWAYTWGLDDDVRGRINRIVDDETVPLGEAIALLDWTAFEQPLSAGESQEAHAARLEEWGGALGQYADRLVADIAALETRYAASIPLWERWRARAEGDGAERWEQFVADARRERAADLQRLDAEVAVLEAEVTAMRRLT